MRKKGLPLDTVMEQVKSKRDVGPNPNFMDQLKVWEKVGYNIWTDDEKEEPKGPYAEYLASREDHRNFEGLNLFGRRVYEEGARLLYWLMLLL